MLISLETIKEPYTINVPILFFLIFVFFTLISERKLFLRNSAIVDISKNIIFIACIPSLVLFGSILLKDYFDIKNIPFIDNPVEFSQNFDTFGKESVILHKSCNFINDFVCYNPDILSPYFPYTKLANENIFSNNGNRLARDAYWKLFWVITERGYHYGPFRY